MCARDVCALKNDFRKFLHCKTRKKSIYNVPAKSHYLVCDKQVVILAFSVRIIDFPEDMLLESFC